MISQLHFLFIDETNPGTTEPLQLDLILAIQSDGRIHTLTSPQILPVTSHQFQPDTEITSAFPSLHRSRFAPPNVSAHPSHPIIFQGNYSYSLSSLVGTTRSSVTYAVVQSVFQNHTRQVSPPSTLLWAMMIPYRYN